MNVESWAFENQMDKNWDKTTELVLRRLNLNQALFPDPVCNIEQVLEARLLGVIISSIFAFLEHIKYKYKCGISTAPLTPIVTYWSLQV